MNHISKTRFPEPLLKYYRTHEDDNNIKLGRIFKKNEAVRKEFIDWAASHPSIVKKSPRLCATKKIAEKINSKASQSKVSALIFEKQASNHVSPTFQQSKPSQTIENYSRKNVITALSLYHLKLINEEQFALLFNEKTYCKKFRQNKLFEILSSDQYTPGIKPIFNDKIFKAFLPYLDSLVGKHLLAQFSQMDENGRTPLFSPIILKTLIPLLKTRNASLTLLSHQDNEGNTPFHINDLVKEIIPLLMVRAWKFQNQPLVEALTKLNHAGSAPLHNDQIMETLIPVLECYISFNDFDSVYSFLSRRDQKGSSPLHFGDTYRNVICILNKMDPYLNCKLHSIQNIEGKTPLHYFDIMEMAVQNMPSSMFDLYANRLFAIKDNDGNTPLHYGATLEKAWPVLMSLKPDVVEKIISIQDDGEITVRQILYDENMAFPLLNNILFNKLDKYKAAHI